MKGGFMHNVLRVFARDVKRLAKAPAAWVVAIALIVLPSLYAWINVYGFWNPYDNTGALHVCVVNEDAGSDDKTLGKLDLSAAIVKDLEGNDQMDWEFIDRDEALAQVSSGEAYAAFIIPPSFSADVASLTQGNLEQAIIEYYVNEKIGPVAPKIMDKGASTLDNTINSAFISEVTATVTAILDQQAANIKQDIEQTTTASFKRVDKAISSIGNIRKSLAELEGAASSAKERSANARTSLEGEKKTLESLSGDLSKTADLVGTANESAARLSLDLSNALDNGSAALSLASSQTNQAISQTAGDITKAKGSVDGALADINAIIARQDKALATLEEIESLSQDERDALLIPTENLFASLPSVTLPAFYERLAKNGAEIYQKKIGAHFPVGTLLRVCGGEGFFGLGEVREYEDGSAVKIVKFL
jgi:putative membrane protein